MAVKWGLRARAKRQTLKQIRESSQGRRLVTVAAAVFDHLVTGGWEAKRQRMQPGWPPLDPEWAMRKGSNEMWRLTGKTMRDLEVGSFQSTGSKGPLRLRVHFKRAQASLQPRKKTAPTRAGKPRAQAGSARPRKGPLYQDVLRRLQTGSGRVNKAGIRDRGRELFAWDPGDEPLAVQNVARALQQNFEQAGIGTGRKGR